MEKLGKSSFIFDAFVTFLKNYLWLCDVGMCCCKSCHISWKQVIRKLLLCQQMQSAADFPALCVVLLFCSVGETVFFVHGAHVGVNPSTTEFSDNVFQCFKFFVCVCFFFPIN